MSKKEKIIKSADLIKESWKLYQKNVLKFIEVFVYGLVGVLPMLFLILLVLAYGALGFASQANFFTNLVLGIIAFGLFVVSAYFAINYSIRVKVASILLIKNNFTTAKENFKEAKPYFIKFLGVSLLVTVLIIAWFFALIIPALVFAVYYGFAQYVLVAENARPFSAVERSYDLVRGYFWPVFGRLALLSLLGMVVYIIITMPMSWIPENSTPSVLYSIFYNLVWAVLSPYFIIYSYNIYKSLKETNK